MSKYINESLPKKQRLGQIGYNNKNEKMIIIEYKGANDIDIQFEDGAIVKNKTYNSFLKGSIAYPKERRIGETRLNNSGEKITIIAYRGYEDIDIQFEDGTIVKNKNYGHFLGGRIAYPVIYGEINGIKTKICKVCKQEKTLNEFIIDEECRDGYRNCCRECTYEKQREYIENNKEKIVEYKKCYHQNNPHKQFNANAKRRELEEKQGKGINKEQWQEMMCYFNWECAYSGISLNINNRTIDHIISLNKNGEHEIWNCVPMYSNYNYSKHNYDMLTWYKKQEFYSEERLRKIYEWIEYAKNKWG